MAKLISKAKESKEFIKENIWKIRANKLDKRRGFFVKQLRIFSLAFRRFQEDNCMGEATALTYYTLFSIVPILALVFAIAKGFGFEVNLQEQLLDRYSEYSKVLNNAFVYANSLLSSAKGGVLAGFGVVLLLWSVMNLLINIETSFNEIFEVKVGRTWIRKITDYLTIIIVGPILLIISGSITVALQTKFGNIELLGMFVTFLINLLAYILIAGVFVFLYLALPNTKVHVGSAIKAAIIATILFELLGWGYIRFQIGASRLNAIYGGFAALPLFLIWLQYSWYIVLFGAELTFAGQHIDYYELEEEVKQLSMRYKKVISLMVANIVAKRFYNGEPTLNANEISALLDLPSRLTKSILDEFVETGIFVEVKTEIDSEVLYQPGVTESKLTVQYIIDTLERKGVNQLPIGDTEELKNINHLMKEMDHLMDGQTGKLYVKDIVA
jgi:membrane protein